MANMLKSCGFFLFYALRLVETCTVMSERFMNKPTAKTISLRLPTHLLDAIKAAANAHKYFDYFWPLALIQQAFKA